MTFVSGAMYGLRWLLSQQHPAAYMASTAASGAIQGINYGMQTGLTQTGVPDMSYGGLLQSGIAGFAQYHNTLRQYQVVFGDAAKSIEAVSGKVAQMGFTKQNLVEYMDAIGRASGRASGNLADLTKNTLAFSRAHSVSDKALLAVAQTYSRTAAAGADEPWMLASRLMNTGVDSKFMNELLPSLANLLAGQMERGGGAQAAAGVSALTAAIHNMGRQLGSERGGAYLGTGAVRLAGQMDAGFASGSAMAMIANPMRRNESWAAYRARLENPDEGAFNNAISRARGMGANAGAILLVKSFGMSYTDALNLIRTGTTVGGLSPADQAEDVYRAASSPLATAEYQQVGATANNILMSEGGLGEKAIIRNTNMAKRNRYDIFRHLFTLPSALNTLLGSAISGGLLGNSGGTDDNIQNLQDMLDTFNDRSRSNITLGGTRMGDATTSLGRSSQLKFHNLGSLKTGADSASFASEIQGAGGTLDWKTGIASFNKDVADGSVALQDLTTAAKNAAVALNSKGVAVSPKTSSVANGRKTPPKGP